MLPLRFKRRQQRSRRRHALVYRWWRRLRWVGLAVLVLLAADLFYLSLQWPDWRDLGRGAIPRSAFMQEYEQRIQSGESLPALQWQPLARQHIPRHLKRAVVVAEDARFYQHSGFDLEAFQSAMSHNLEMQQFRYGASTISQQTIKNLYLSSSRTPLRKWHELVMTLAMEFHLDKGRILELYLNIAEFGPGVYGVAAAAQHYWGLPVSHLTPWHSAQLAACLPSPLRHNPGTGSRRFYQRAHKVYGYMQ
ncbi:MAG: monofunctional biosynthetic peptidoglycan transglycosylase [Gammaproteobacteria bacterium]